jgi:uncharacterized Zn finger protein
VYFQWKPYVSAAARRKKASRKVAALSKKGRTLVPVTAGRGAIAKTFWGKSWCDNLQRYSDFANRLPRGRTYLRNGSVLDLQIAGGDVSAQVLGSRLYQVALHIAAVPTRHWRAIGKDCADGIDSLVDLLQGRLSPSVMERVCRQGTGLFPAPAEIKFSCSCPDWAGMCKHVAAVFYGIGVRLDVQPELLFTLRKVDAKELISRAGEVLPQAGKPAGVARVLDTSKLSEVFGIEMADPFPGQRSRGKSVPAKTRKPAKANAAKRGTPVLVPRKRAAR